MAGRNVSHPASGSKRIIEGIPAPIAFYMDLALNMKEYLEEIMGSALEEETESSLKSLKRRSKRYEELGKDFSISYKNETFSYAVTGESAKEARALEYGPPARSLVRHEAIVGADRMSRNLDKKLKKLTMKGELR